MSDTFGETTSIMARVTGVDGDHKTAIPGLFFARRSKPTEPIHLSQWPCFALVAQGAKSLTLGNEEYRYGVGHYLVVSMDLPVVSMITEATQARPHLGLGMAINRDAFDAVLRRVTAPAPALNAESGRGVAVNIAPPDLLDAVLRYLQLLDKPQDIPAMAPLIEQEILYRLLTGPYGNQLIRIATADSPGNRIARAAAWLRANYDKPLRIQSMAADVGMSVSSLHHHFKAITAMSPMQYHKQVRLNEARRLMLVENLDVGNAAHQVGYRSLSQFGLEYSRLYGESPLRDIARLRKPIAAE